MLSTQLTLLVCATNFFRNPQQQKARSMFYLDHIVLAVRDLKLASNSLRERFGLGTVAGGNHPEWGTGNLIVPLGKEFIEVAGITDLERAQSNPVGQIFLQKTVDGDKFLAPVLGVSDPSTLTKSIGLSWSPGERKTKHGTLRFWSAGIERSLLENEGWSYFFDYDDDQARLGVGNPMHDVPVSGIKSVIVSQDRDRLCNYLGGRVDKLIVENGVPSVISVTISTEDGDLILPGKL